VFRAEIDGQPLTFFHTNMVNVNMTFADIETRTRWQQGTGEAFDGPLTGRRLEIHPFLIATWQEWRERHPETLVMEPVPGFEPMYEDIWNLIQARRPGRPAPPELLNQPQDARLPGYEPIIGLEAGGARRAYPLAVLRAEHVVNDRLGSEVVLLIANRTTDTVTVFSRSLGGRTLNFERQPTGDLVDVETGSRWNAYGECLEGELRGSRLPALTGVPQFWWAWAQFSGGTDVYGER
jgi:hypothetical protein